MIYFYNGFNKETKIVPITGGAEQYADKSEKYYKHMGEAPAMPFSIYDSESGEGHWNESGQLALAKPQIILDINNKSNLLLSTGVEYNGKIFSSNYSKWLGWEKAIELKVFTLPFSITATSGEYEIIKDETEMGAFLKAIAIRIGAVLKAEGELKNRVFKAVDFAELGAVDDART